MCVYLHGMIVSKVDSVTSAGSCVTVAFARTVGVHLDVAVIRSLEGRLLRSAVAAVTALRRLPVVGLGIASLRLVTVIATLTHLLTADNKKNTNLKYNT